MKVSDRCTSCTVEPHFGTTMELRPPQNKDHTLPVLGNNKTVYTVTTLYFKTTLD